MCGIAGIFDHRANRTFDLADIKKMTDAIAHRGPDGEGFHVEPGVALGHRRLSIIDLEGGSQPMSTSDGELTVIFNGEIYNFLELRAELAAKGAVFVTDHSDTEVLLHGWRHWGEALLDRIGGMFAFALWDRSQGVLFLARDRFGKKPLHYAFTDDGRFTFGSELKAIKTVSGIDRRLDHEAIEDFFAYGYVPDPKTIYRGVRKLPPGSAMLVKRGSEPRIWRYWTVLDHLELAPGDAEEQLLERLDGATTERMMSDVPLGALLSGGVDSSAVVALMARQSSSPINTFSISFKEKAYDESNYALEVSKRYGTHHDARIVDSEDFSLVDRLPKIYDEPFGDISAIPTFVVCEQARRSVTVALSGDGGDEALAGYRRYRFHMVEERLRAFVPAGLRYPLFRVLADIYPRGSWLPRPLRAKATFRELSLSPDRAYFHSIAALPDDVRAKMFTEAFKRDQGGYDPSEIVRRAFNVDAPLDPLQRAQYADVETYLPGDILTKVDRASMANSLELRAPFLDADFFSYAFSLPISKKIDRRRGGKAVLKKAFETRLSDEILYRPKQGFTVPVAAWFRGPLKANLQALCSNEALRSSGVIDMAALGELVAAHTSGLADNSSARWLIWVFAAFLDGEME